MSDRFIVQTVTYFTAKILELNDFGVYEEVATVQSSGSRNDALRLTQMLNTADHIQRKSDEPL